MKTTSTAVACPGLPLIFAEGYMTSDNRRVSLHGHMSLAYTSVDGSVRTETNVSRIGSGVDFKVNGKPAKGARAEGMRKIVDELLSKSVVNVGVRIESVNHNIATGSSDSGAAALSVALNDLLELNLSLSELCEIASMGSETAYRSILGGLSEYSIENGKVSVRQVKSASELASIVIYAVPFNVPRHSADELHSKVATHPEYARRDEITRERIIKVKELLKSDNLTGMLEVMENDARDVHKMFEEVGLSVIKPPMRKLCAFVESIIRRGVKCYWNVAGGSQVYVLTVRRYADAVETELEDAGWKFARMKAAGPAVARS